MREGEKDEHEMRAIVQLVHKYNEACGKIVAAYTFDAGPNAVIFVEKPNVPTLLRALLSSFPSNTDGRIVSSSDDAILNVAEAESSKINDDSENTFLNWSKNIFPKNVQNPFPWTRDT